MLDDGRRGGKSQNGMIFDPVACNEEEFVGNLVSRICIRVRRRCRSGHGASWWWISTSGPGIRHSLPGGISGPQASSLRLMIEAACCRVEPYLHPTSNEQSNEVSCNWVNWVNWWSGEGGKIDGVWSVTALGPRDRGAQPSSHMSHRHRVSHLSPTRSGFERSTRTPVSEGRHPPIHHLNFKEIS
jgi:hypothetical protein